jgi:hypothetical protein
MRIQPGPTDASEFVTAVNRVVDGLLRDSSPQSLVVIQIDNWFSQKWLGFSGLPIPHVAAFCRKEETRIPPFVPNRVVSERWFAAPLFEEADPAVRLHLRQRSKIALRRKASEVAPGSLLVWYSGNSANTGRGSLMAYIPEGKSYRNWYAQWQNANDWHSIQTDGIKVPDLRKLMEPSPRLGSSEGAGAFMPLNGCHETTRL